MKSSHLISALFAASFASAAEPAKTAEPAAKIVATEAPSEMINKATCTFGSDTRELEIVAKDDGHTTNYTKGGEMKEVATCSNTKSKCQEVFDNIKAKLENAGFVCKT